MSQTAKLFLNGRSQAVRLPAAYRFDTQEVFVRKDPNSGDVIQSRRPQDWQSFLTAAAQAQVPDDFLSPQERQSTPSDTASDRDPFASLATLASASDPPPAH